MHELKPWARPWMVVAGFWLIAFPMYLIEEIVRCPRIAWRQTRAGIRDFMKARTE